MNRRDGYWLEGEHMYFFVETDGVFPSFDVFVEDNDGGLHSAHSVSGYDTDEQMLEWITEYDTPEMQAKYLRIWVEGKPNPVVIATDRHYNYTAPYGNDCPECDDGA